MRSTNNHCLGNARRHAENAFDFLRRGRSQYCARQPARCMLKISLAKLADADVNAHGFPTLVQSQHVTRHRLQRQAGLERSGMHLQSLAVALEPLLIPNLVCIHIHIVRLSGCARTSEEQFSQHLLERKTLCDEPLQCFRGRQQIPRYLATHRLEL